MKHSNYSIPASWTEHDQKIKTYLWSHRLLSLTSKVISIGLFLSFLVSGRFVLWQQKALELSLPEALRWFVYFAALGMVWEIVGLPLSLSHHWVERAHGLSRQTYAGWFVDRLKGYGVGGVMGILVTYLLYSSVQWGGELWWLLTALGFIFLSVVLAQLAPVLLIPLFFKLKPMENQTLRQRLLDLSRRFGVHVQEVYQLGMGEKTEKGNAAFVGLGKTKRILIGDTLYEKFPIEEVEAVFAHELGHQVHKDLVKGICLSSGVLLTLFFITQYLCTEWIFPTFQTNATEPFGLVMFLATFSICNLPTGVLQNIFSRSRERKADRFAMEKLNSGEALASALERLTLQNRGLFCPHSWIEFLTYSHPAPWRRITRLRT